MDERLLTIHEAVEILQTSKDHLYRHWKELPFAFKFSPRQLRFRCVAYTAISRSNNMPGRVFKRNEIYWIAFYCKGKEYRTSAKTTKKRKAEEVLAFYLEQVARGEFTGFQQEKSLTLSELLTLVLDDVEVRELRDVDHMRFRAEHLLQFFGARTPAASITEAAIARYVARRRKHGRKLSTINRELAVLRQALRLAKKRRLVHDVPDVERFPEHNVRLVFFEPEVYEAILAHLTRSPARCGVLCVSNRLARRTDCPPRLAGCASRGHPPVGHHGQTQRRTGAESGGRSRRDYRPAPASSAPEAPWVFHRDGRPIRDFRAAWKTALAKAGVTNYHFHDFRRTATRNMALAQVPEKHIMQVTGHKTRHMMDRYNITVEQDTHHTMVQTQTYLAQQRKHGQYTDNQKMQ